MATLREGQQSVSRIVGADETAFREQFPVATTNEGKLRELRRILGPDVRVVPHSLQVDEIQSIDPDEVVRAKAKAAYMANGNRAVIVEDTALHFLGSDMYPPTLDKFFTNTKTQRAHLCDELAHDPRVRAEVGLLYLMECNTTLAQDL